MTRWTGIFVLSAVAGAILGILGAYLLFKVYQKIQERRQVPSTNKESQITIGITKQGSKNMEAVGIGELSSGKDNAPEILLKTHNKPMTSEKQIKPPTVGVTIQPDIVRQSNRSLVEEQKESVEPVLNLSPVISGENISRPDQVYAYPKTRDPQSVAYRAEENSEITIKSQEEGVSEELEIVNQKKKSPVSAPKKPNKTTTLKELKTSPKKKTPSLAEPKQSPVPGVTNTPPTINQQIAQTNVMPKELSKSDVIKELETNLAIAATPWSDKVLPFKTSSWDSGHGKDEKILSDHIQEIMQLYIDIGLANNIAWMATEIGHRSKDLDESYIKLCAKIAERTRDIMSLIDGIV
jgi:hypothetical protein